MFSAITQLIPNCYSQNQWLIIALCALLIGVNKTGIPGVGIMLVPLIAAFFDAKESTGLILPMLAIADIFAVAYYHKHAKWSHIIKLLPAALLGIAAGSLIIRQISSESLKPIIGIIVLAMLVINYWRTSRNPDNLKIPKGLWFAITMGFLAGLTTQMANAAGPIMIIYLLSMKLSKYEFMGTGAWYFLILNWLKIPIFISEGRISTESITANIMMLPIIAIGALLGIYILKKLPQKWFQITIQILAVLAAIKLITSAF